MVEIDLNTNELSKNGGVWFNLNRRLHDSNYIDLASPVACEQKGANDPRPLWLLLLAEDLFLHVEGCQSVVFQQFSVNVCFAESFRRVGIKLVEQIDTAKDVIQKHCEIQDVVGE